MKRTVLLVVSLFAIAITVTGCGAQSPTPTPSPTGSATTIPIQTSKIFYVGDTPTGFKLFSENHVVSDFGLNSLITLISDLVSGLAKPLDPQYSNLWGNGTSLNSIKVTAPLATVDLHLGKLNVGSEAEMRAIDQILWTITKFMPKITQMNLLVDGKKVESLAGHVDATKTFVLEPTYDVLSPLEISSISEGANLVSPVTITGEACTFEANVVWKLTKEKLLVKSGATTAQEACPTRSTWTLQLGKLLPGNYELLVEDFSAKDGSLVAQDTKNFTVLQN